MSIILRYGASIIFVLIPTLSNAQNTISQIAERILPAIVVVNTATGNGSGVIVDASGVIATNYHVIEDSSIVSIELQNGDTYQKIGVIDIDQTKDIAILKIDGFDLPTVEFGNSNSVVIGEDVLVMGAPQGLEQTVTRGIVSAIRDSGKGHRLIQTDAAISPGSSGGGMFNSEGELIGLTVSYLEDAQNINFVIPINYVRGMFSTTAKYPLSELADRNETRNAINNSASTYNSLDEIMAQINVQYEDGFEKIDDSWYLFDDDFVFWSKEISNNIAFTQLYDSDITANITDMKVSEFLRANYSWNYAKVAIDSDDDIIIINESNIETLTAESFIDVISGMIGLHSEVKKIATNNENALLDEDKLPLTEKPSASDRIVKLNEDLFTISFNEQEWEVQSENFSEAGDLSLIGQGDTFIQIISEGSELTYDYMEEFIFEYIKDVDTNSQIIGKGFREVNGINMLWLQVQAEVDGLKIIYYYHVFTGTQGSIQIMGWTTENLMDRRAELIDNFVSGFKVN
tara:strand:+ start:284 stop:1828 length:1545 start_codon:yes stop_codon:yes gene_type:complete